MCPLGAGGLMFFHPWLISNKWPVSQSWCPEVKLFACFPLTSASQEDFLSFFFLRMAAGCKHDVTFQQRRADRTERFQRWARPDVCTFTWRSQGILRAGGQDQKINHQPTQRRMSSGNSTSSLRRSGRRKVYIHKQGAGPAGHR